jgi:soluble lytic murein transglycosylase-like protein
MYHISPEATTNIQRLASRHGIPAEYAYGLVDVESSFKQSKRSGVGAVGLAQVRPEYAGKEVGTPRDVLERSPVDNLDAGFEYLRRQKERFGTWERALDAYNRGPTAARRRPSRGYARKVMGEG